MEEIAYGDTSAIFELNPYQAGSPWDLTPRPKDQVMNLLCEEKSVNPCHIGYWPCTFQGQFWPCFRIEESFTCSACDSPLVNLAILIDTSGWDSSDFGRQKYFVADLLETIRQTSYHQALRLSLVAVGDSRASEVKTFFEGTIANMPSNVNDLFDSMPR